MKSKCGSRRKRFTSSSHSCCAAKQEQIGEDNPKQVEQVCESEVRSILSAAEVVAIEEDPQVLYPAPSRLHNRCRPPPPRSTISTTSVAPFTARMRSPFFTAESGLAALYFCTEGTKELSKHVRINPGWKFAEKLVTFARMHQRHVYERSAEVIGSSSDINGNNSLTV